MAVAQKAAMGGERRRVYGFQNQMLRAVDMRAFFLRVRAPEHKDDMLACFVHDADDRVGENLPAAFLVRTCLSRLHRQRGIEQQNPLLRPAGQIAG